VSEGQEGTETEAAPKRAGLADRLGRERETFQPALWSRLVGILLIAAYLIAFVVLNTRHVKVSFVVVSTRVSVIWVILLSLVIGLVLGVLLSQLHRRRSRTR
jgi:uncharacterized integral membrane protein